MTECSQYQELISRMLDGDMSEQERERLHAHVSECADCRRALDAFTMLKGIMAEDLDEPPAELASAVMEQVLREPVSIEKKRNLRVGRYVALAAGLAIIVFAASRLEPLLGRKGGASADAAAPAVAEGFLLENKTPAENSSFGSMSFAEIAADAPKATEAPAVMDEAVGTEYNAVTESVACEPEGSAPETLDYEGETYMIAGYLDELPESEEPASLPAAVYAQNDLAEEERGAEKVIRLIDGRLYLLLDDGRWAEYEKEE